MTSLAAVVALASASCSFIPDKAPRLDETEAAAECVTKALPKEVVDWLNSESIPPPQDGLEEWSRVVEQNVPTQMRALLVQLGRESAAREPMGDLNAYYSRLIENFSKQARALSSDDCFQSPGVSEMLFAQIVSKLGADVRGSEDSVRLSFESVQNGRYYSGNVLFVWLSLQSTENKVRLADLLARYYPSPATNTLFK